MDLLTKNSIVKCHHHYHPHRYHYYTMPSYESHIYYVTHQQHSTGYKLRWTWTAAVEGKKMIEDRHNRNNIRFYLRTFLIHRQVMHRGEKGRQCKSKAVVYNMPFCCFHFPCFIDNKKVYSLHKGIFPFRCPHSSIRPTDRRIEEWVEIDFCFLLYYCLVFLTMMMMGK